MSPSAPGRGAARRVPFALLVLGLLVGGLVLLLTLNTAAAANELSTSRLQDADSGVSAQVEQLQTDIADRSAPAALADAARQLGMIPAPRPAFLIIGRDGAVHLAGRPTPVVAGPLALTPAEAIVQRVKAEAAAAAAAKAAAEAKQRRADRAKAAKQKTARHKTAKQKTAKQKTANDGAKRTNTRPATSRDAKRPTRSPTRPDGSRTPKTQTITLGGGTR